MDVGVELGRGSHDVEVEPGGDAEIRRGSVDGGEGVLAHVRSQGLEEGREVAFGEPGAARAVSVEPDELHLDRERLLERGREALDLRVQRPAVRAAGAAEVRLVGRAQVRVRVPRREGVGVRRAIERGARAVTAGGVEVGVRGRERGTAEAREREEERRERETRATIAREPAAFGTRRTRPRAPRRKHRRADATRGATRRTREAERGERRGGLAATPTDRREGGPGRVCRCESAKSRESQAE